MEYSVSGFTVGKIGPVFQKTDRNAGSGKFDSDTGGYYFLKDLQRCICEIYWKDRPTVELDLTI